MYSVELVQSSLALNSGRMVKAELVELSNRKNFLFESDRLSFIRLQNEKKKALAMTVMVALPIVSHMSAGCCKV
ncbi:hypothetical protein OUZ56_027789 [Daphnia magna]|uniref:Uncharacterized protein n=1 Tax=Daphnia magna TaxID=35525 RepID=A0ABR0B1Y3_9CRUS|nr:hypothetical protein OUZ56_027789 [Daphnia magna]